MLIIEATGLEKDALHIYVGVSVFLLCLLVFRRFRYRRDRWDSLCDSTVPFPSNVLVTGLVITQLIMSRV